MPSNQNSIDPTKRLLPGFIPYWSRRFSFPNLIKTSRPRSVRFHLIRGRIQLGLGRYDQAISDFRSALLLDWRNEQADFWLGRARRATRHTGEARSLPQS